MVGQKTNSSTTVQVGLTGGPSRPWCLIVLPFGDDFQGKPTESGEADGPEKRDMHR